MGFYDYHVTPKKVVNEYVNTLKEMLIHHFPTNAFKVPIT